MSRFQNLVRPAACAAGLIALSLAAPLSAQSDDTVSRPVVQALPPAASDDLNEALMRLARDERDVDALIAAGLASLELDDVTAAIGFFDRAKALSPENARVMEGMGAAYVRGGQPVRALELFAEAEEAGVNTGVLWADRGLAYDLVGQNKSAQDAYRRALSLRDDEAVRLRLALSYAIAGDKRAFDETLKPLLDQRDFAAYRTRSFGLAVLGEAEEAIEIARAVMPRDMAGRMEPYLRFMPRLTPSQQAAAANLGIYPAASRIGRDDPRIVEAAATVAGPATVDLALAPRGAALGPALDIVPPAETGPTRRDLTRMATRRNMPPMALPAVATPSPIQMGQIATRPRQLVLDLDPAPVAAPPPGPAPAPARASATAVATAEDLAGMGVADAFADFELPSAEQVAAAPAAVDISTIEPPREEPAVETPPPAPSRIWLQLGIGQNTRLLRGDWRIMERKARATLQGKGPFVTPWGQTNRLLAGPFESQREAREALNALSAADIESFVWVSPEGEEIRELR